MDTVKINKQNVGLFSFTEGARLQNIDNKCKYSNYHTAGSLAARVLTYNI
ncbi:hypothetical protein [Clostridium sp. Marseille-Q7071]